MVPGMSERDRLAADARRLAWLADATIGPARITCASTMPAKRGEARVPAPLGLWRRGLSSARVLGQRIRLLHLTHPGSTAQRATSRTSLAAHPPH